MKMAIGRRGFLGVLAKISFLSLIPGIPALAQRRGGTLSIRSPKIKGKTLSQSALTQELSSSSLEDIRDMVTGKFYAGVSQGVGARYTDIIDWNLGSGGINTGCVIAATYSPTGVVDALTQGACTGHGCHGHDCKSGHTCSGQGCEGQTCKGHTCKGKHTCSDDEYDCSGAKCDGQSNINWQDFGQYADDAFVSEITNILNTTDVAVIRDELIKVIFSDDVLSLGAQHFANSIR
jgi:hypothetical protein